MAVVMAIILTLSVIFFVAANLLVAGESLGFYGVAFGRSDKP